MSVIYYKFKASKDSDYDVFTFDGPNATVFDVKKEIMRAKRLGKGTDLDLAIYNAQTDEEYNDDTFMVPRNTSVIVRRLPPSRPGKGTAQRYVQGAGPMEGKGMSGIGIMKGPPSSNTSATTSATMSGRRNLVLNALPQHQQQQQNHHHHQHQHLTTTQPSQTSQPLSSSSAAVAAAGGVTGTTAQGDQQTDGVSTEMGDSEEARIQAMFQQTTDQWGAEQERLAEQQFIPYMARGGDARRGRGGFNNGTPRPAATGEGRPNGDAAKEPYQAPQRIPPSNYVCYRCGQKGHFINQCPTNGDKDYDKHPRIKRTTGIPRSFLKVIEQPKDAVKSGTGGLMVTPKGDIVVAQADSSTWDQHMAKAALGDTLDWYDSVPVLPELQCPLCMGLMREATITPCCGASFCDDCIRNHLMEHDFHCGDCQQVIQHGLDGLMANMEVRQWIDRYVRQYATKTGKQQYMQLQRQQQDDELMEDGQQQQGQQEQQSQEQQQQQEQSIEQETEVV